MCWCCIWWRCRMCWLMFDHYRTLSNDGTCFKTSCVWDWCSWLWSRYCPSIYIFVKRIKYITWNTKLQTIPGIYPARSTTHAFDEMRSMDVSNTTKHNVNTFIFTLSHPQLTNTLFQSIFISNPSIRQQQCLLKKHKNRLNQPCFVKIFVVHQESLPPRPQAFWILCISICKNDAWMIVLWWSWYTASYRAARPSYRDGIWTSSYWLMMDLQTL